MECKVGSVVVSSSQLISLRCCTHRGTQNCLQATLYVMAIRTCCAEVCTFGCLDAMGNRSRSNVRECDIESIRRHCRNVLHSDVAPIECNAGRVRQMCSGVGEISWGKRGNWSSREYMFRAGNARARAGQSLGRVAIRRRAPS